MHDSIPHKRTILHNGSRTASMMVSLQQRHHVNVHHATAIQPMRIVAQPCDLLIHPSRCWLRHCEEALTLLSREDPSLSKFCCLPSQRGPPSKTQRPAVCTWLVNDHRLQCGYTLQAHGGLHTPVRKVSRTDRPTADRNDARKAVFFSTLHKALKYSPLYGTCTICCITCYYYA